MANEKRLYKGNVVYSVKGIANISGVKESAILCRAETLMLKYPKNVYRISNEDQAYFFDEVFISALADSMYDKYVRKSSIVSHKKYRAFIDKYCTFEKAVIVETKKEKPEPKPEGYMTMLEYMHSRGICSSFASGKFYQEREVINSHRKMVAVNNKRGRQSAYGYDEFAIAHVDEVIRKIPVRSKAIFNWENFRKHFPVPVESPVSSDTVKVPASVTPLTDVELVAELRADMQQLMSKYDALLEMLSGRNTEEASNLQSAAEALIQDIDVF